MRLWVCTSPDDFSAEFDDIEQMFSRGLSRLILSKRGRGGAPYATESDYERWLMALPMECRDRVWVRGTPDVAEQLDVRGCIAEASSLMGDVPEIRLRARQNVWRRGHRKACRLRHRELTARYRLRRHRPRESRRNQETPRAGRLGIGRHLELRRPRECFY